jgi:hypothetical protein
VALGEFLQGGAFELGEDDGAAVVLHEAAGAVGDHVAAGGADAEAEHADVLLLQLLESFFQSVSVASPSLRTMRKRSAAVAVPKACSAVSSMAP